MTAQNTADAIRNLAHDLAQTLRAGTTTIADARQLVTTIRQAEGWLLAARNFLDPDQPLVELKDFAGGAT